MKRFLAVAVLGGLLMVGIPTPASSADPSAADPGPDPGYCGNAQSARSARCDDPRAANHGVPPGTVVIRNSAFNPAQINSRVRKDVTWVFDDHGTAHTVTADNGSFDSGRRVDGEFHLAFPEPGSYSYHCAIHPDMHGTVFVGRES